MMTLEEARERLLAERRKGTICPCCDQHAKIFKRKIHWNMARAIIAFWRCVRDGDHFQPVHLAHMLVDAKIPYGDASKLKYWGLLEEELPDGRGGYWRMTQKGIDFVLGKVRVPKYILIYDDKFLGNDGAETADIADALAEKFDYWELMNS